MNASDPRGPRANLLYWNQNRRSQHRQALSVALILASTAAAAYAAMNAASDPLLINALWLDIGKLAAILLVAISSSRFFTQLVLATSRPNQTIYLYDRGFTWHQGRSQKRYLWSQVQHYHENLRGPALLPFGSLNFRMEDERVYRLRPAHGNLRRIARLIRPYLAQATAQKMRAQLQHDRPVRLNRHLLIWPNGVTIKRRENRLVGSGFAHPPRAPAIPPAARQRPLPHRQKLPPEQNQQCGRLPPAIATRHRR